MRKTLSIHGNSLALVIEKPILELLRIDAQTPLDISTDGKNILIVPRKPKKSPILWQKHTKKQNN